MGRVILIIFIDITPSQIAFVLISLRALTNASDEISWKKKLYYIYYNNYITYIYYNYITYTYIKILKEILKGQIVVCRKCS